jgi:tetratricopeptide (TPR) repeat protein
MRGAELYDRVINWPGPAELTMMFAAAVVLISLAALLLSIGRLRMFARILGVLGMVSIMVALFVIHEQSDKEKIGQYVTVTRMRYPEPTRFQIRVALLGLPGAAAVAMTAVSSFTRRRLRSRVPQHLMEGRRLLVRGEHGAALEEFNRALQISPFIGEAYFQRGCAQEARGKLDEALADFDHALRCDAQLVRTYLHRGCIRSARGELDAALADFDQVIFMRPSDAECHLNRGICMAKKGLLGEAILDFQRVLKLTNHSAYADPARFYLNQLGGENPPQSPGPSPNGAAHAPSETTSQPTAQDYVL